MLPTIKRPNAAYFILLLMPFIKPALVESYPLLNTFFTVWKLCSLLYLTIFLLPHYIALQPKKKLLGFFGLCVFWIIYTVNCAIANADLFSIFIAAWSSLVCFLLVAYQAQIGNGWLLLKTTATLSLVLILLHAATAILMPTSASTVFLFGMDNYSAFFIYPMLCIVLFYQSLRYGRLKWHGWLLLLLTVFVFVYTASYTAAAAGLLFFALMLLYPHWEKLPKVRGIRWLIPLLVIILWLIVEFQIQNVLATLLDSMSKGVTLNSRTIIWDHALTLISQRPLLGHGGFTQKQLSDYILYGTSHAHNLILELLLRTGMIGTLAFMLFQCGFIRPFRTGQRETRHTYILVAGLISQLCLAFMDYYPTILVYYIFMAVLYYRNCFVPPQKQPRSQS